MMPEQRQRVKWKRSHGCSRQNLTERKGRRQQALVMPGRNAVAVGSGGEKFKRRPGSSKQRPNRFVAAPRIKSLSRDGLGIRPTTCWSSHHDSKSHEAKPVSQNYAMACQKRAATHQDGTENIDNASALPERSERQQKRTRNQRPSKPGAASRPNKMEGSKTHQQAAGWNSSGAANASSHSPDRNHAS